MRCNQNVMWLIRTDDLELVAVFCEPGKNEEYEYAILSHRWQEGQEVSFKEFQLKEKREEKERGYEKILWAREEAEKAGLHYLWIDTCCINKDSEVELGEAIRSMYKWYASAKVCYAYLSDVESKDSTPTDSFENSAWFKRGWTLQELVAPKDVIFFGGGWQSLGTKQSLLFRIADASGIDVDVLKDASIIPTRSIAQRMSWASKRNTTRPEDMAYCLLGLFGIHLDMKYSEGVGAFIRLQEEIIKRSDDCSILAWSGVEDGYPGLLATTPKKFENCGAVTAGSGSIEWHKKGFKTKLKVRRVEYTPYTFLATLGCKGDIMGVEIPLGIHLRKIPTMDEYCRVKVEGKDLENVQGLWALGAEAIEVVVVQEMNSVLRKANYFTQPKRIIGPQPQLAHQPENWSLEDAKYFAQPNTLLESLVRLAQQPENWSLVDNDFVKWPTLPQPGFRICGALQNKIQIATPGASVGWDETNKTFMLDGGAQQRGNRWYGTIDLGQEDNVVATIRLGLLKNLYPVCEILPLDVLKLDVS